MRNRTVAAAFCFATAVAAIGGVASSGCSDDKGISSPCPPGATCQVRLTLLHTADIHSRLLPYDLFLTQIDSDLGLGSIDTSRNVGGIARMAYVLGRERARADRVLHLDSGDCFQGAPIFNFFAGEPEVRAMSMLGTDAAVIGNHEFDRGALNAARQMQRWASFPLLGANYYYGTPDRPETTTLNTVLTPFAVFNQGGLKVGVIGMGNLSSLTSIFDQPNRTDIKPLDTVETAQAWIDTLRPMVDVVVMVTHLGLEVDQAMIKNTTGIDVVLGGHNHIVVNPPQRIEDCSSDPQQPGYIWELDSNLKVDPNAPPPFDELHPDPYLHPYKYKRPCKPRRVLLAHSGAFAKYIGRLDLVVSNSPTEASPTGDPADYDRNNKFEVVSNNYNAIPITDAIPEDPLLAEMIEPYRVSLDRVADLDLLAGYSPQGAKRFGPRGGDSPLGNLVASAMWLRLGVQTDFALTNSTGVRTDLLPGPITIEQMYNIFPFDNSIAKMQLTGAEVTELFDFVARRSASRACAAQSQIAGARVRLNCSSCARLEAGPPCETNDDCEGVGIGQEVSTCNLQTKHCSVNACAEQIFIGHLANASCATDADCPDHLQGQCDRRPTQARGFCSAPIFPTNVYELATSNYLATGGSGYRVLQRNTTQFDTKIQQRDALIDFIRQGKPCGYNDPSLLTAAEREQKPWTGLKPCSTDSDCSSVGDFVCACEGNSAEDPSTNLCITQSNCNPEQGRCILRSCRNEVAAFHNRSCSESANIASCKTKRAACFLASEECKLLACVDDALGAITDDRMNMVGQ